MYILNRTRMFHARRATVHAVDWGVWSYGAVGGGGPECAGRNVWVKRVA